MWINKTYYDAKMVEIFVCTETPRGIVFVRGKKLTQKMAVPVWTGGDVEGKARHVIDTCQSTVAEPAHQLNTHLSTEMETVGKIRLEVTNGKWKLCGSVRDFPHCSYIYMLLEIQTRG